jgi:hypothetical protein
MYLFPHFKIVLLVEMGTYLLTNCLGFTVWILHVNLFPFSFPIFLVLNKDNKMEKNLLIYATNFDPVIVGI